eukprot:9100860-Pyramimonas_sp.AAC.1
MEAVRHVRRARHEPELPELPELAEVLHRLWGLWRHAGRQRHLASAEALGRQQVHPGWVSKNLVHATSVDNQTERLAIALENAEQPYPTLRAH